MWIAFLLTNALAAASPTVEVQPLAGDPVHGAVASLGSQGITVQTSQGPVKLELGRLMGITVKDPHPGDRGQPSVWLEMIDGSTPVGTEFSVTDGKGRLSLANGATLDIPVRDIRWVRFQPQTEAVSRQWAKLLEGDRTADFLVVKKGEEIDHHKGVLKNVTPETVQFELDGELLPVKRAKVHGIIYHQSAGRELPEVLCTVREASGQTWSAKSISLDRDELEWTTATGIRVNRSLSAVARIDFSRGKIAYLSDLKPESVEWVPYFAIGGQPSARAEFFAPRQDRSLASTPLQIDGKRYAKGLAIHSRTTLVYRLPERYRRFSAVAGIDDRVRPRGNVQLVIRGDDRVLLNTPVAGTEPPKQIDVNIADVRRLTIFVDFGEDLDVADHLDLCEAKLIK